MQRLFLVILALALVNAVCAQSIHDVNDRLGRGVNYGNMFEAPGETEWGNPWQPEYPEIIASLGFNHVRMPIRWSTDQRSSDVPPYTIEPSFLQRIRDVVDATLEEKLMVIINMHHHEELFSDPQGEKARFLAQWEQISAYFKDYPDSLVFEILNEPHNNLTPELWNEFVQDALDVIRVDNPDRAVLIGPADYNSVASLSLLELPDDDNIILSVHYYNPFNFTHQGAEWAGPQSEDWLGTEWLDTDVERAVVTSEFAPLIAWSQETGIPVNIGEFGAYQRADMASRSRWTTYLARYFESNGWSWAYWEFSAGFGFYNPASEALVPELVDALLVNEMPEPLEYERTQIYESDFSSGLDGWFLNVNGASGAQATMTREGSELKVTIDETGTENWHIQMVRPNVPLKAGRKYALSFTAHSTADRPVSFSVGQNSDPWTGYGSTYVTVTTEESSFTGMIDMISDDPQARFSVDIGTSLADFYLSKVVLEELVLPDETPVVTSLEDVKKALQLFPNPAADRIRFLNDGQFTRGYIADTQGRVLMNVSLAANWNEIDINSLARGMYILMLEGKDKRAAARFVRK